MSRERRGSRDSSRATGETIRYVDYVEDDGAATLEAACNMELEGIVPKRLDSAYRAGLSHDCQKTKCEVRETFAIAGYGVDDNGGFDGILPGRADDGALRYAGTVDRGRSDDDLAELERLLPVLKVGRCRRSGTAFFFKQWGGRNKKQQGRMLDGKTWDEFPAASP